MKTCKLTPALIILYCLSFLCSGDCDRTAHKKVLPEKLFIQIYCDVLTYADLIDVQLREAFVDSVLKSHHITREDFQQTVNAYSSEKNKWESVFAKIVAELERREKEMAAKDDSVKVGEKLSGQQ